MSEIERAATPPKRRMSAEARREKILESAAVVFGRLGFEAARMEDVAKEAGIAKGLLYKHFGSKDALFRALVDRQGTTYADSLRATVSEHIASDPAGALTAGLTFWLGMLGDERVNFTLTDPGVHDAYDGLRRSLRNVIAEGLRTAMPAVPEPYPELVAALVQGSAESLGLVWREHVDEVDEDAAVNLLARFCWGGLVALGGSDDEGV